MSRYRPVSLRHKQAAAKNPATTDTLATLGLRAAAIVLWIASVVLFVGAVRTLIDNLHAGAGLSHWQPAALLGGAAAAAVVAWRVWAFKTWACIVTIIAIALLCLLDPWRPDYYRDAVVRPGQAIAGSLVGLILFVAPLIYATYLERSKLRSGF